MVSAPNSPMKSDDKENAVRGFNVDKQSTARRHSLAPSKSILKNTNLRALNESDMNHTITIMQKIPSREPTITSNRRVSFAPEVTLHKIDMIPQYFDSSPKRQPRRRDTLQFVPPIRTNNDEFEDRIDHESSDMDIDDDDDGDDDDRVLSKSPFVIFQDERSDEEDDDDEFDSLFNESAQEMDLVTHHSMIRVDEIDKLKSTSQESEPSLLNDEEMELTVHHGAISHEENINSISTNNNEIQSGDSAQDMELTLHQGGPVDDDQDMELTLYQGKSLKVQDMDVQDMELTNHKGSQVNPQLEVMTHDDMEITMHPTNNDELENMDLTIHKGIILSDSKSQEIEQPAIAPELNTSQTQMGSPSMPEIATTNRLSEIAEMTEPEEEEPVPKKNPQLEKVQAESNFNFDSSEMEEHDVSVEVTTTAFGDPSIFEDILRVTGGSQDEEEEEKVMDVGKENLNTNTNTKPTPTKRAYDTPKKSLTTDAGSPQERSSSLKKRRLSFTPNGDKKILRDDLKSPITYMPQMEITMKSPVPAVVNDVPPTPTKDSMLISSPEHQDIEVLIQSLTPNRTKKRESFGYVSQSPRRRSISDELTLTPLKAAKQHENEALNLQKAVITTTVPLAGNDDSQDIGDVTDDYVPVELQWFLRSAGVKFYDDLNVRDTSNDLRLESFDTNTLQLGDYLMGLQKLKNFELLNFSCNELKKNINEGKKLFDTLEQEVSEENPPLIREYMEADPQVQSSMNIQFQVLKNYARQQAKNVWYGWRSSLVEGVHQGLLQNKRFLEDNQLKINVKLEELTSEHLKLTKELMSQKLKLEKLMIHKAEFEECDKEELMQIRSRLINLSEEVMTKKNSFEELISKSNELQTELNVVRDHLKELNDEIEQLNFKINENEIYSKRDIKLLQLQFSILERVTGLRLDKIEGDIIKMKIDHIEIEYNHGDNTSSFHFKTTSSPILNKFQETLLSKSQADEVENISIFLQNYRKLFKIDGKFEKLRMFSNDPIKLIDDGDSILIRIKEVHDSFKKIISFKINSDFEKIEPNDLNVETVNYKEDVNTDGDDDYDTNELKLLLRQLEIM